MNKKVFIGVGHGGSDPGAVANGFKESNINLTIATYVKDDLLRHNVDVKMSRIKDENDPLTEEIKECNLYKPNLAVDIHTNAGGGDGFEVLCTIGGGTGRVLAINIDNEVKLMGQNSRGVKTRTSSNGKDYFGFIRETTCPAVICEGFFIDNKKDLSDFDTDVELKALATAYAKGILKTLGIEYKFNNTNKTTVKIKINDKYYEVEGMLVNDTNFIKVRELEKAGFIIGFEGPVATIKTPCCCK